jgi:hypothetical protein
VTKALPALRDDSDFTACVAFAAAGEDVLRDSKPAARLIALPPLSPSAANRGHPLGCNGYKPKAGLGHPAPSTVTPFMNGERPTLDPNLLIDIAPGPRFRAPGTAP